MMSVEARPVINQAIEAPLLPERKEALPDVEIHLDTRKVIANGVICWKAKQSNESWPALELLVRHPNQPISRHEIEKVTSQNSRSFPKANTTINYLRGPLALAQNPSTPQLIHAHKKDGKIISYSFDANVTIVQDPKPAREDVESTNGVSLPMDFLTQVFTDIRDNLIIYLSRRGAGNEAEDMAQQVYENALRQGYTKDQRTSPEATAALLFKIAHNLLVDGLRKSSRRRGEPVSLDGFGYHHDRPLYDSLGANDDPAAIAVKNLDEEASLKQARQAILALPETERLVVELKYIRGLSNQEVALKLGMNEGAVREASSAGVKKLRKKLKFHERMEVIKEAVNTENYRNKKKEDVAQVMTVAENDGDDKLTIEEDTIKSSVTTDTDSNSVPNYLEPNTTDPDNDGGLIPTIKEEASTITNNPPDDVILTASNGTATSQKNTNNNGEVKSDKKRPKELSLTDLLKRWGVKQEVNPEALADIFSQLTEEEKTIIDLRFGEKRSFPYIANLIGCEETHVGILLTTAARKLQRALNPNHRDQT